MVEAGILWLAKDGSVMAPVRRCAVYGVREKRLLPNLAEAETVRQIFEAFLRLGAVSDLQAELRNNGVVNKVWISTRGNKREGKTYSAVHCTIPCAIPFTWARYCTRVNVTLGTPRNRIVGASSITKLADIVTGTTNDRLAICLLSH